MRKHFLWSILSMTLAVMLSVQFTSCGSNDDKTEPIDPPIDPPVSTISTNVTNLLDFSYGFAYNFQAGSDVKFFNVLIFSKAELNTMTQAEIINRVSSNGTRTAASNARFPKYISGLQPNTEYCFVIISYDNNDSMGEVTKQYFKTKPDVNQPEVYLNNVDIYTRNNIPYWDITVTKGNNGYCSKFYVWLATGIQLSSVYFSINPYIICWYLKQDIDINSRSHTTSINKKLDEYIYSSTGYTYTSDCIEILDGPKTQDTADSEIRYVDYAQGIYVLMWGMDSYGNFSGLVTGAPIDFSSSAKKLDLSDAGLNLKRLYSAEYFTQSQRDMFIELNK